MTKGLTSTPPSKLKFLLGHHLATNSFGLGRLFDKSSRQLQNFRRHGDQNGRNLEGWHMVHRSNRTASQDSQLFFVVCFQHNEHFHPSNTKSLIVPVCTSHLISHRYLMFHFWSNMMASTFSANKHPLGTHWAKEEYICYTQSKNVE